MLVIRITKKVNEDSGSIGNEDLHVARIGNLFALGGMQLYWMQQLYLQPSNGQTAGVTYKE
jgi:hypothetical protein